MNLLESHGAEIIDKDIARTSTLSLGASFLPVVKFFLHKGVRPQVLLLHASRFEGNIAVIRYLVEEIGVNVNLKNQKGETPLFICSDGEIAKLLIRNSAFINAKDDNGR